MSVETPAGILTFLIADVRGYTAFTQAHGDEGAGRLADKFAELTREGVEAHGGELTELRGDEALAVFSSPRAALRAAVDLQMVFADETAIDPSLPMTVGIGIDAGEAVAVQGGYRGGALNLAARLCSKAAAGEVLVSQGVAHLTRAVEGIDLEQAGEAEMKGLAEPVRMFRARTRRSTLVPEPGPGELPAALAAVTPMIGRESDVRRLRWWWRLARRGSADLCLVLGPPGIGKTRLVAELASAVAAGGGDCRYFTYAVDRPDLSALVSVPPQRPELLVLDDLETATGDQLMELDEILGTRRAGPRLVVLVIEDQTATSAHLTAARRLVGGDDRIVRPRPLTLDEMQRVAGFYLGAATDVVPVDVLADSGGVPRLLHERISEWAHQHAARRLGDLASAAASGRSDLRNVESDLAGTVIDLQLVREQATLFGLGPGRRAPEPTESPYRGLASFDVDDGDVFFGRERLVAELISRLAGASVLGVVGASGSGKSSAVRAGLVPALRSGVLPGSDRWTVAVMRPSEHPLRALDRALWTALPRDVVERLGADANLATVLGALPAPARLVVVVDQAEEAFTLCQDDTEREEFLWSLADAVSSHGDRVAVVVSVRADYYGRFTAEPRLAEQLASNHVLVGPMSADEYRRAIVQPALRVGAVVETELVDDLVAEVIGEPGALPLLSTTLLELWDHREGRTLRRSAYLASGGVRGAVARLADEVYDSFDEEQQQIARGVLLRLTGPGAGDSVVRRRVPLSEFDADRDRDVAAVLDVLATRRLLTISDGAVEVAHEALLREWPRLTAWLDEDREGRRLRAHLAVSAQEWAARQRDNAELYRGARLSAALDWTTQHTAELNEVERDFITASQAVSRADLDRQQRQNRRLRGLLVGVVGVLVLALVAGGVALAQRQSAKRAANRALARQLGAEAVSAPRIDQALLLARQAVLLDRGEATEGTLLATLLRSPAARETFAMPIEHRPLHLAASPDGRTLAVADNSGSVRFFDTSTRQLLPTVLADHGGLFVGYAGSRLFADNYPQTATGVPTMDVFDAKTRTLQHQLKYGPVWLNNPTGQNNPIVASGDGARLYYGFDLADPQTRADRTAYVEAWDVASGRVQEQKLPGTGMVAVRLLADGRLVVVTNDSVLTLDAPSLRVLRRVSLRLGAGVGDISPDGRTVAFQAAPPDGTASPTFTLVDVASGRRTPAQGGHAAQINSIQFTPDGRRVVTAADDQLVKVWDATSGALVETLAGHGGRIVSASFGSDPSTLFSVSLDGAIFRWDLGNSSRFGRTLSLPDAEDGDGTPPLALSADGRSILVAGSPGQVTRYDVATLRRTGSLALPHHDKVDLLTMSHGGTAAVALATSGVQLWNRDGTSRELTGLPYAVQGFAFSPDDKLLAAATDLPAPRGSGKPDDGWFGIWDVTSGRLVSRSHLHTGGGVLAWTPDGAEVVANFGGQLHVYDKSGHELRHFDPKFDGVTAIAALPSGEMLVGTWAGVVQKWNPLTGKATSRAVLTESAPVSSLALSPDRTHFVTTGGSSGGVRMWDTGSLVQFGSDLAADATVWGNADFTSDGRSLVAMFGTHDLTVWPIGLQAWMAHACAVAGRNFTHEEWRRFVPGHAYSRTCPQFPAGS